MALCDFPRCARTRLTAVRPSVPVDPYAALPYEVHDGCDSYPPHSALPPEGRLGQALV